jgi:serine/threonine protein kinase
MIPVSLQGAAVQGPDLVELAGLSKSDANGETYASDRSRLRAALGENPRCIAEAVAWGEMASRKEPDGDGQAPQTRRLVPDGADGANDDWPAGASEDYADTKNRSRRPDNSDLSTTVPPSGVQRVSYSELAHVDPATYQLGAEVARGGMGRIRTAFDRRLGRDVAIKELLVQHPELVRWFEREARITAQLQHPSIVSVHEAGRWPDGMPFYAMRWVAGRSLADAIRDCETLADRLTLLPSLLAVADAIAYAHARRVIHRDLKPSNVILGEFGETVVIDWGLAKRVGESEPALAIELPESLDQKTHAGSVLGTPGFMAPEQSAGSEIDERADVFALGMIIAHVLTGQLPLPDRPLPRLDMIEGMPPDLVAIVERAAAADATARYPTARELADDLRRFQTGQLVGAHRYSSRQLMWRWVGRHRTALVVGAAAFVVLAVVGTVSVASIVRERARVEQLRALAVKRGSEAEDIMGFMLFDLAEQLRQVGRLDLMDKLARRAIVYYEKRDASDKRDPEKLIVALINIGDVLRDRGDLPAAREEYRQALTVAEAQSDASVWRHHRAVVIDSLGIVTSMQGDLPGALVLHREALAIATALAKADPSDTRWKRDIGRSHLLIAAILEDQGKIAEARAAYEASLAARVDLARSSPTLTDQRELMIGHSELGLILERQYELDSAARELRAALAIAERHARAEPQVTKWQRDVGVAHERVGDVLILLGERDAALAEFRVSLDVGARLAAQDPSNADWQRRLSVSHERVGSLLLDRGDLDGALAAMTACRQIRITLAARDATNSRWQRDLSVAHNKLGDVLLAKGNAAAALTLFREALAIRERLVAQEPSNRKWLGDMFAVRFRIGRALVATGDVRSGISELVAAITIADDVLAADHTGIDDRGYVEAREALARARVRSGDRAAARADANAALASAQRSANLAPADSLRRDAVTRLSDLVASLAP